MERRGRGNGRGSRGRGQAQRDNQHGQPYHQQQQQQRPQSVDPPRQSAWGGRGRGNGAQNPRAAPSQVEQVSAGLQEMRVSRDAGAGDAPRAQPAAKTGEVSRGARRQGLPPEPRPVLKSSKQGKAGVGEMLKANYFNFAKIADMCCYQYRVDFLPDPDVTVIKKALLNVHKDDLGPAYLFDGTVLWTTHRVNEEKERVSMRQKTEEPVKIQIKLRTDISPKDPSYIHFLNVIMRKTLAMMEWKIINRDYFDPSGKVVLEQHQLEIWPGFSTSIRQHEAAVLLNVEVASKVMRRETAYDLLCNVRSRRSDAYKTDFEEEIIGQTVITPYNNTTYRIDDVDWDSSPNTTFDMKGNKVSFKEYYQNKYELRLRYPDQPLLVTKPTKRDIRAGKTTVPKLVPELCCLTGVDDNMRANFHLMKAIAEHTKVAPGLRVQRIENGFLKTLMTRPNTKGELQKWNMGFQPKVVEFSGRRLNPEEIIIGRQISVRPNVETADFTQGLTSQKAPLFATPALNRWVVIHPQRMPRQEIEKFVSTLQRACSTFKYSLAVPQYDQIANDRGATYAQSIENWINQRAEMVMCLVPQKRADRYEQIKKKCYVHRSIPSQVVVGKNVSRANMSVCTKIGIQMVCKQGGTPWTVKIPFKAPPMFVGFDVCHDTSSRERSFGALVASVNPAASRYASFVYPHKRGEEICPFIGQLMLKAVIVYQKKNEGALPTKIIFYRDGVGEGNYHYVQVQEVDGIKNALKQLYGDNVVPLVYVIVTKRINTRLFRANNSNPLPGTIADSCVTNPTLYDFFLVSQSVTEGTVAPTSYVVLADEIAIPPDHLQQLTYKLCHLYYNWSGTIRVPAPVQYAHKLAFLAGQSLHTTPQAAEQTMEDILYFL